MEKIIKRFRLRKNMMKTAKTAKKASRPKNKSLEDG